MRSLARMPGAGPPDAAQTVSKPSVSRAYWIVSTMAGRAGYHKGFPLPGFGHPFDKEPVDAAADAEGKDVGAVQVVLNRPEHFPFGPDVAVGDDEDGP